MFHFLFMTVRHSTPPFMPLSLTIILSLIKSNETDRGAWKKRVAMGSGKLQQGP